MTYDMYRYLFIIAISISLLLLALSTLLFIKLEIPKIIRDLSGVNAKRAIERIRMENEASGEKVYKPSSTNIRRGKITDKMSSSGRVISIDSGIKVGSPTEKLNTQLLYKTERDSEGIGSEETTVLEVDYGQEQHLFDIEFDITFIHTNEIVV